MKGFFRITVFEIPILMIRAVVLCLCLITGVSSQVLRTQPELVPASPTITPSPTPTPGPQALGDGSPDFSFSPILSRTPSNSAGVSHVATLPGGDLLAAGMFKVANGKIRVNLARLTSDGTLDDSINITLRSTSQYTYYPIIRRVAVQPDGRILIAGTFNFVNNSVANNIARLNPDGSLDSSFIMGTGFNNEVSLMTLQLDGKILLGGNFSSYNGTSRGTVARLNTDGTLDTSFAVSISTFVTFPITTILATSDGKVFLQGSFYRINGVLKDWFVKLNNDGSLDTGFVLPAFSPLNSIQTATLQADGKVFIAGSFEIRVNSILVNQNLARLNPDGSLDQSFSMVVNGTGSVTSVTAQEDGRSFIFGAFTSVNGVPRNQMARLNSNGTLDQSFIPFTYEGFMYGFAALENGRLLVFGNFTLINGTILEHLARIEANGSVDQSFTPQFGDLTSYCNTTAMQPDGKILVAGSFTRANGVLRGRIARFNPDSTLDDTFNTVIDSGIPQSSGFRDVNKIALQPDGRILIGGAFGTVNGQTQKALARLEANGQRDQSFNPVLTWNGSGSLDIFALVLLADGKILIGGHFVTVNGIARSGIARLNSDGSLDTSFQVALDGTYSNVYFNAIVVRPDGKIAVGGDFKLAGATSPATVAQLESDGAVDGTFQLPTAPNSTPYYVRSLALEPNGKLLIGGTWSSSGRPVLMRLNIDGTADASFNPGQVGIGFFSDMISSIIVQRDSRIIVAGGFSSIGGTTRRTIARLANNGAVDLSFNAILTRVEGPGGGEINSLVQAANGNLVYSGNLLTMNGVLVPGFGRLKSTFLPGTLDE